MRKVTTVIMSTVMATSCILAYADSLGSISVKSSIECEFSGEIYIIVSDTNNNRKLVILNSTNNYEFKLDKLDTGNYNIVEVHVYNTEDQYSDERKEIPSTEYTLEYDNLNINENNQSPAVLFKLHSLEKENDKDKEYEKDNIKTDNKKLESDSNTKIINENESEQDKQKKEKEEKLKQTGERHKKIYFINFIIDAFLILGLGSIWFFKIRKKKNEME